MNVTTIVGSNVYVDDPAAHLYEVLHEGFLLATASGDWLKRVLVGLHLASPAAYSMPLTEVIEQVNEANAGEIRVQRFYM